MKRFEKEAAAGRIKKIYFFNFFIPFRSLFRLYPLWVLSRFPTLVRHSFVTQKRDGLRKTTDDDTIHLSLVPLAKILRCRHQENSFFVLAKCLRFLNLVTDPLCKVQSAAYFDQMSFVPVWFVVLCLTS